MPSTVVTAPRTRALPVALARWLETLLLRATAIAHLGVTAAYSNKKTRRTRPPRTRRRRVKKEFWEDTIVLVSKDANLTKSHARYVESRLIAEAQLNPHWSLPNRQEPSKDAGGLPVADQYDMRKFIEEAKMLAGVLGCDLFRSVRATRATEEETGRSPADSVTGSGETFSLSGKGFEASMRLNASGDFVVQAGSRARLNEAPSIPDAVRRLRQAMLEAKDLGRNGEFLVLSGDYSFRSVSSAAGVVHGASVNGRNVWKHEDGRTYGECEAGEGPRPS